MSTQWGMALRSERRSFLPNKGYEGRHLQSLGPNGSCWAHLLISLNAS